MAPKFALFTKPSKLPLNQGFQNRLLVTTISRQALEMPVWVIPTTLKLVVTYSFLGAHGCGDSITNVGINNTGSTGTLPRKRRDIAGIM